MNESIRLDVVDPDSVMWVSHEHLIARPSSSQSITSISHFIYYFQLIIITVFSYIISGLKMDNAKGVTIYR